jgi:predicted DNA-binding protein with PD1-like motif
MSMKKRESLMVRSRQLAAFSGLLLAAASIHAQTVTEGATRYLAPQQLTSSGQAPAMKVQLLNDEGGQKEYAVIFSTGDEAFAGLKEFAQKYHVTSAHFTAIGAISGATLAWFDPSRKMYKLMPFSGQMEVASMIGDIALYQGKPAIHTHAVLGLPDGTARAGHVVDMTVRPTLEVMVTVDPKGMQRQFDPQTDLTLITPAAGQ